MIIKNARVFTEDAAFVQKDILIEDGVFTEQAGGQTIDAAGCYAIPGLVDIHFHGCVGYDFCDGTHEAITAIARYQAKNGVTAICPATMTLPEPMLETVCRAAASWKPGPDCAALVGINMEGPFVSLEKCGAQNPAFVRQPDYDEVANLNSIAKVLLVSLAPEMPGAIEFIEKATANGIRCSAGHSAATHEDFTRAKSAGLAHLTHYCNQMSPLHHREIGLVGSGLLDREIKIEIICDTIHLCADMLKTVFKNKDSDQMLMITDSLACSWMPDGPGDLGGLPIIVKDGVARLQESGALAGSTLKYAHGLKNVHRLTGKPLSDLVKATSWNQAQSLGLEGLGKIAPGFTADMVLLDDDFNTCKVFIDGVEKYSA